MSSSRVRAAAGAALALLAIGVLAGLARRVDGQPYATTAAWHEPALWVLLVGAGVTLAVAAALTSALGLGGGAQLLLLAVWTAPLLVGWETGPASLRVLGLASAPFGPALALAALGPYLDQGIGRRAATASFGICALAGIILIVGHQPFRDARCFAVCGENPWALTHVDRAPEIACVLAWLAGLALGVRIVASSWPASRWLARLAVIAASATAVILPALPLTSLGERRTWLAAGAISLLVESAALVGMGTGVLGRRRRVGALVRVLAAAPQPEDLTQALSHALRGPVSVTYPDPLGTGHVDGGGNPAVAPTGDRLEVTSRGEVVAVISGPGATVAARDPSLSHVGPMVALLVENSAVVARLRAQVARVRSARAAVVSAHDEARAALERDLHDGAQQLVLALTVELRLLADCCPRDGTAYALAGQAREEVTGVLHDLRSVAHGLHPAVLAHGGLESATELLTEHTGVQVVCDGASVLPSHLVLAAYRLIETAAEQVQHRGGSWLHAVVEDQGDRFHVWLSDGTSDPLEAGVEADRVAALGGELSSGDALVAVLPVRVS